MAIHVENHQKCWLDEKLSQAKGNPGNQSGGSPVGQSGGPMPAGGECSAPFLLAASGEPSTWSPLGGFIKQTQWGNQ